MKALSVYTLKGSVFVIDTFVVRRREKGNEGQ